MSPAALEKMEDTKPLDETVNNSHSDSTNLDPSEARFAEFCKNGLSMDENTCTQSMKLFKETKHLLQTNISAIGNGTLDEAERFWFAFVLYSIKRLSEKNGDSEQQGSDDNGFTLCQILRAAKLNIVDFFKELPQFVVKAGPILSNLYGADWEKRLEAKELQANFVHLSLLSKWPSMISLLERNKTASCSHHFNQIVNHQLPQLLERCKGWNRDTTIKWPCSSPLNGYQMKTMQH